MVRIFNHIMYMRYVADYSNNNILGHNNNMFTTNII